MHTGYPDFVPEALHFVRPLPLVAHGEGWIDARFALVGQGVGESFCRVLATPVRMPIPSKITHAIMI